MTALIIIAILFGSIAWLHTCRWSYQNGWDECNRQWRDKVVHPPATHVEAPEILQSPSKLRKWTKKK